MEKDPSSEHAKAQRSRWAGLGFLLNACIVISVFGLLSRFATTTIGTRNVVPLPASSITGRQARARGMWASIISRLRCPMAAKFGEGYPVRSATPGSRKANRTGEEQIRTGIYQLPLGAPARHLYADAPGPHALTRATRSVAAHGLDAPWPESAHSGRSRTHSLQPELA
jgi:hypothetical protein